MKPPTDLPADRDPDVLLELAECRSSLEAEVLADALRSHGIFARAEHSATAALGLLGPLPPARVLVRRVDMPDAREALAALRADSTEIDWDTVDVGEMPPEVRRELDRPRVRRLGMAAVLVIGAMVVAALLFVSLSWGRAGP